MAKDSEHTDDTCLIPGVNLLGCGKVARRLRPVGLIFSMALHVAVVAGGLWLAATFPHTELPSGVYEVEIIRPEPPPPVEEARPETPPAPVAPPEPQKGQVARSEAAAARPAARPAPRQPEPQPAPAIAPQGLDMVAPARVSDADLGLAEPAGPAEPGALDIAPRQERPPAQPVPKAGEDAGPVVGVVEKAGETDVGGLHGFAAFADSFALDQLAREEFELREFAGFYQVQGQPDRFLVVVDASATRGRLLLLDRRTGFLRALTPKNTMVYTYGPAGGGDEPVEGVVYLMPRKARYANENINLPHQIVWMRDQPPALVAQMVRIREEQLTVRSRGRDLEAMVAMPLEGGSFPGVVWLPGGCEPASVREGFARSLAVRGLAVLVFDYPGCRAEAGASSRVTLDDLARDVAAALAELRAQDRVDAARCGLWGRDKGLWVALRAAVKAAPGMEPSFVVCAASAGKGGALAVPEADAAALRVPQFWLLSGPDPAREWRGAVRFLGNLARSGRPVEATLFPEDAAPQDDEAASLARQLMPWYEDMGARWVLLRK